MGTLRVSKTRDAISGLLCFSYTYTHTHRANTNTSTRTIGANTQALHTYINTAKERTYHSLTHQPTKKLLTRHVSTSSREGLQLQTDSNPKHARESASLPWTDALLASCSGEVRGPLGYVGQW